MRILLLHNIVNPHMTPVFEALSKSAGVDLTVAFFAEREVGKAPETRDAKPRPIDSAGIVGGVGNIRCLGCIGCVGCVDCVGCIGCVGCVGLRGKVGEVGKR